MRAFSAFEEGSVGVEMSRGDRHSLEPECGPFRGSNHGGERQGVLSLDTTVCLFRAPYTRGRGARYS